MFFIKLLKAKTKFNVIKCNDILNNFKSKFFFNWTSFRLEASLCLHILFIFSVIVNNLCRYSKFNFSRIFEVQCSLHYHNRDYKFISFGFRFEKEGGGGEKRETWFNILYYFTHITSYYYVTYLNVLLGIYLISIKFFKSNIHLISIIFRPLSYFILFHI